MTDDPVKIRRARKPQELSLGQLFHAVDTIQKSGHAEEFLQRHSQHTVIVDHKVINSAKAFLLEKQAHVGTTALSESARQMIVSPNGRCPDPADRTA